MKPRKIKQQHPVMSSYQFHGNCFNKTKQRPRTQRRDASHQQGLQHGPWTRLCDAKTEPTGGFLPVGCSTTIGFPSKMNSVG